MVVKPGWEVFGRRARGQYAALLKMRWRMFMNGLHSVRGIFDLGATGIAWLFYGIIGVGAGLGLAVASYAIGHLAEWRQLPALFWIASVLWLMVPVFAASYQEQSDLGIMLRFPIRLRSYLALYLISGMMEASTIVGALCCIGIWLGIVLARPRMGLPVAVVLGFFAGFNILLVRTVFAWIDRWLAQRKSREILGMVLMALFLGAQLFNPALYSHRGQGAISPQQQREQAQEARARYEPMLKMAYDVQQWLPAGTAARAIERTAEGRPQEGLDWLAMLGIWTLGAGGTLTLRLRSEYRGENLGWAPPRSQAAGRERTWTVGRTLGGSGACAAALEKEARSLLRTPPLLWSLGAPLLMVLVIGGMFHLNASAHSFPYALPLCVAYALLGFTSLFYNSLGAEGAGVQLLLLSPTPVRTVFIAKNLLHAVLFMLAGCTAVILGSFRLGAPTAALACALGAWLVFALLCNLAAGNILSLTMPYRINPGRIMRQSGSQANALTAMLIQAGTLAVGAAVLSLCWSLDKPWLAVPIFLVLAVAAYFVWKRVLTNVDAMVMQRREELIATLMKVQ